MTGTAQAIHGAEVLLRESYGFEAAITDDEVAAMIQQAREFLAQAETIL